MLQKFNITSYAFILCLFGFTLMTGGAVFAASTVSDETFECPVPEPIECPMPEDMAMPESMECPEPEEMIMPEPIECPMPEEMAMPEPMECPEPEENEMSCDLDDAQIREMEGELEMLQDRLEMICDVVESEKYADLMQMCMK